MLAAGKYDWVPHRVLQPGEMHPLSARDPFRVVPRAMRARCRRFDFLMREARFLQMRPMLPKPLLRFCQPLYGLPTEDVEIAIRLVDLVFPEPGEYRLQLFGADQFLRERRFLVISLENPGNR